MSLPTQADVTGQQQSLASATTTAPVNSSVPSYLTINMPTAPTQTPAVQPDSNAEQRIRDLMSQKDKAAAELARSQQEQARLLQELEAQRQAVAGATAATQSLLENQAKLERERSAAQAETLKLQLLGSFQHQMMRQWSAVQSTH